MKEGEKHNSALLIGLFAWAEDYMEKFAEKPRVNFHPKETKLTSPLLEKPKKIPPSHTLFINQRHTSGRRRY